jgi:hypothetical protein
MKNGPDVPGSTGFTDYSKTAYKYTGDNVSNVTRHYGTMTGNAFGAVTNKYSYDYYAYDDQVSPFTIATCI